MTSNFPAKRAMAIKYPAENVAFVASKVLNILTQLRLIKIKRMAGVQEISQCTCIGDANNKVQRYGCANIVLNVAAQAGSCTMQALRTLVVWAIKMGKYIISGC